jgi:putative spermidine/putrescine transport system permease protein
MRTERKNRSIAWLALPGGGFLGLVFALPLLALLTTSFIGQDNHFTISGYIAFFSDKFNYGVLFNTLKIATWVTLICLFIGYGVAFAMARASAATQGLMFLIFIIPLSVGVVVKAFAWTILLRSNGLVNRVLISLGLTDEPLKLLFTESGLIIGAVHVFLPFMVLPIFAVVRQLDHRLAEAAWTLGANPVRTFVKITLPLTLPGVVTGCSFVFSMALSMYVIPSLLIGDRYQTLPALIARAYLFMRDRQNGSVMAVPLLFMAIAVVVASALITRRLQRSHQTIASGT